MKELKIRDEFIKLGQALKLAGLVGSGFAGYKILTAEGKRRKISLSGKKMVDSGLIYPV